MGQTAEEIQARVRAAMEQYSATVLQEQYLDADTGIYKYPHRIARSEVLRLAQVKSRSTLGAAYHAELSSDLDRLIAELKDKAGKGGAEEAATEGENATGSDATDVAANMGKNSKAKRLDSMAQTIMALQYRVMALEQELDARKSGSREGSVINLTSGQRRNTKDRK